MYIPNTGGSADSSNLPPGAARTAVGEGVSALVTALSAIPGVEPGVVNRAVLTYSTIPRVDVGDEYDHMGSRRRARRETYETFPV